MKQIHYVIRVKTMKDTEHKISITSEDIDKIDEAIREEIQGLSWIFFDE